MDVIDQATDTAQADLRLHLHQTRSRLLRAIEEALARIDRQAFGVCETCKRPISPAGQMPCPGRASTVTARSGSKVERLSSLGGRHLDRAWGWIVWVIFGRVVRRDRPILRWFHILSLIYSLLIENLLSTLSANDGPSCVRMMASVFARRL